MRSCFSWLGVVAAVAVLFGAADVHAQAWLADRTRAEGRGIRLGDFELHPGIGAEIGWISNVFLQEKGMEQDSAVLRVSPHIYLSTLSGERAEGSAPAKVAFRAGATGAFKHYFAVDVPTNMGVGEDARLVLRPSSIFAFELFDEFHRSTDPFTDISTSPTAAGAIPDANYARDQLGLGTRLQLSTPGALLKAGLGYRVDFDHFEDEIFQDNRNRSHTITGDTSWEFLPQTALFWNGAVRFFKFTNDAPSVTERSSSTSATSRAGINGALTSRVGFTLGVGYTAGFVANGNDYENISAQAEVRWKLRDTMLWSLGYERDSAPAFQGDYTDTNRIKTRLQMLMGGAFLVALRGEVAFVSFGYDAKVASLGGDGNRDDIQLLVNLSGEYRVVDWFAITGELGYLQDFTDFEFPPSMVGGMPDAAAYKQFQGWFGLRVFM